MLNLETMVNDVIRLSMDPYSEIGTLIAITVSAYLEVFSTDDIVNAFDQRNIEAAVGPHHLFIDIGGGRLRIPLSPLMQGDSHETQTHQ